MAEHLFYVSLKYTKTVDVILNLISRWEKMLEKCVELLLKKKIKEKKLKQILIAPKARELKVRQFYKEPIVEKVMDLYSLFRQIPNLDKVHEHEFRKNVALRIRVKGEELRIDMEKLKEWNELINAFYNYVRKHK